MNRQQTFRILCLSYDLTDVDKWECGKKMLDLTKALVGTKKDLDVKTCSYKISVPETSKFFGSKYKPDLIITQQYASPHAKMLKRKLNIPLVIIIHNNVGEYRQFYPNLEKDLDQPDLILCSNESICQSIREMVNIKTLVLDSKCLSQHSEFWDLVYYKISIIVPCHGKHINHLDELFDNFTKFVVKPYEVVVSVSLEYDQSLPETSLILNDLSKKYNFQIKFHISNRPLIASQNRNLGASQSNGDILLFLDADDVYHPQLLEVIKYFWKKFSPINVHWKYLLKDSMEAFFNEKYQCSKIPVIPYQRSITHGHAAIDRNTWKEFEWPNIVGGEDCDYFTTLYNHDKSKNLVLDCNLSLYQIENSVGLS